MFKKFYFLLPLFVSLSFASYSQIIRPIIEGFDNVSSLPGNGWSFINKSDPPNAVTNWRQGDAGVFSAQNGAANSYIQSYGTISNSATSISNWLIAPQRTLHNGDVITFYTRTQSSSSTEALEVRLSTNGNSSNIGSNINSFGDFTRVLDTVNKLKVAGGYPVEWKKYTIKLSGLNGTPEGRIALRHINGTYPGYFYTAAASIDNFTYSAYQVASVLYVDSAATESGSGLGWGSPFKTIGEAFDTANANSSIKQIWVKKGTYYPDEGPGRANNSRNLSFGMKNGLAIYGGFAGGETDLSQRNWRTHKTVLSGEIQQNNDRTDNASHVIQTAGLNNTAVLDGFTVTEGRAYSVSGAYEDIIGGGMYNHNSSPGIINCTFSQNLAISGGGMFNDNSSPGLVNCTFTQNEADFTDGGGMHNDNSSPILVNCTFTQNKARFGGGIYNDHSSLNLVNCSFLQNNADFGGGGMANGTSSLSLVNCSFSQNKAGTGGGGMTNGNSSLNLVNCSFSQNKAGTGGGMRNNYSSPSLVNCTFSQNDAGSGGGMSNRDALPKLTNCILWGNTNSQISNDSSATATVSYSIVQGGYSGGTNNSSADPKFVDADNPAGADGIFGTDDDGLRLQAGSPAINAGNNDSISNRGVSNDITGALRIQGDNVDMGSYERFACLSGSNVIVYVDSSVIASGNGSSWALPYKTLGDALRAVSTCSNINQVWVKKGTYYPTTDGNRDSSFRVLRNGIKIYGGFGGVNPTMATRNPALYPAILSGDITNTPNDSTDNSYHVMTIVATPSSNIDTSARVDGFIIQGGSSNGSDGFTVNGRLISRSDGAGIYNYGEGSGNICNPAIAGCTFIANSANSSTGTGGALFNNGYSSGASSPFIINCSFSGNSAYSGGAVYNYGLLGTSSPSFYNCVFSKNSSTNGGAILNYGFGGAANPSIIGCTFFSNRAGSNGGAMNNIGSGGSGANPQIVDCILWGNTAASGADISNINATPVVRYSLTQTYGQDGVDHNIVGRNPHFVNAANPSGVDGIFGTDDDGLRLQATSPAINAGNNDSIPAGITTDITGVLRIQGNVVDMGAYESTLGITGPVVRVDSSIAVSGDGSSWDKAVKTLSEALDAANSNNNITEIWVAKGTYFPTSDGNRDSSFRILRNGIKLYGGFAGIENVSAPRNITTYRTILSGDIGTLNDSTDNSHHVITVIGTAAQNIDTATRLDGFEIRGGTANGSGNFSVNGSALISGSGGGIYNYGEGNNNKCSPAIANCTFTSNSAVSNGGAIHNNGNSGGTSSPVIINCTFHSNRSTNIGGAICNDGYAVGTSSPAITNCTFHSNSATYGGAIYNDGDGGTSSPAITNCTFHSNRANSDGGAIAYVGIISSTAIANSIFYGNIAPNGSDILNFGGPFATVSYSITQTTIPGQNNQVAVNPLFVNVANLAGHDGVFGTSDDGLRLQAGSPAINAGNNDSVAGIATDITGAQRIQDGIVDMGAYESTADVLPVTFTEVKASRKNTGIQVDWQVATEINIHYYEVEKSVNGRQFTKAVTVITSTGNNPQKNYTWFDAAPFSGNNFYRIKAVEYDGGLKYTGIVKVNTGDSKREITVYPNPVTGNSLTLQFGNQPKGRYVVQLFNGLGQQVHNSVIEHTGGSATQTLHLNQRVSKGIYRLSINNGETKSVQQVMVD